MSGLRDKIACHAELRGNLSALRIEMEDLERKICQDLIDMHATECLSIRWGRLYQFMDVARRKS